MLIAKSIGIIAVGIFWILAASAIIPKTQKTKSFKEIYGTLVGFREHFTVIGGLSVSHFQDFQEKWEKPCTCCSS